MYLVQIIELEKYYGKFKALDKISINIKKGDIVGYLGPNGSGKTTTIKILAGLLTKYKGEIIYKGERKKNIGCLPEVRFIFDNQNFYENLTAYENLEIISRYNGIYNKKKIIDSLEKVGLSKWVNSTVKKFSRGMRQRLAIAMAEMSIPELLILDEPTNGLDIEGIMELEKYFKDLNKNYGTTIILSSHYLEQIERLSDHIIIINKGKKLFDDNIYQFRKNARIGVSYIFKRNLFENLEINEKIKDIFKKENIINLIFSFVNNNKDLIKDKFYYGNLYNILNESINLEFKYENKINILFSNNYKDFEENILGLLNSKINELLPNEILYIEPIVKSLECFFIDEVEHCQS
ncbi:MAG: ABC transporter ATP-binding protein [Spirochaetes bacterium]|nr:ABC transporter ATP-binding protein [Spirochaetota bacterium]